MGSGYAMLEISRFDEFNLSGDTKIKTEVTHKAGNLLVFIAVREMIKTGSVFETLIKIRY